MGAILYHCNHQCALLWQFGSASLFWFGSIPDFTMLRHLAIRNFAIVNDVKIDVEPGFTVITGETGAGKSILVDALGLLLGARADAGLIAPGHRQAELEAVFEVAADSPARAWLQENALEEEDQLIVRRVLTAPSGSRAWINGRSATVGQLARLGELLVEIHGQHAHQLLNRPNVQRQLLDRHVDQALLEKTASCHSRWLTTRLQLDELEKRDGSSDRIDLLRFQVRELTALELVENEFSALEKEHEQLARSDELQRAISDAVAMLEDDAGSGARNLLQKAADGLQPVLGLDESVSEAAAMLQEAGINIDEALSSLERAGSRERGDAQRLDEVGRRLETLFDLGRKYRVQPNELPALADKLAQQLAELENMDEQRGVLENRLMKEFDRWSQAASKLSDARLEAAETLSGNTSERLAKLGMDTARIEFSVQRTDNATPAAHGMDRIEILFSANPGQPPRALSRVASGGELSRIGLALMTSASHDFGPQTRIFDEVDAGVGGETAHAVGHFLRAAADGGQAMCVTQLAQVAACADHQLLVKKEQGKDSTRVEVKNLKDEARTREVARMLGSASSSKSLAHARELLEEKSAQRAENA